MGRGCLEGNLLAWQLVSLHVLLAGFWQVLNEDGEGGCDVNCPRHLLHTKAEDFAPFFKSPGQRAFVYSLVSLVNCASAAKDAAEAEATRAAAVAKAEVERSVSC